ncbi:MAG: outer membrane efflux protein [Nitrospirae bacterium]|nr:MAG: outer membrane efflux protein [Nitrospirota bacterium]
MLQDGILMIRKLTAICTLAALLIVSTVDALTLEESLARARDTLPGYKAALLKIRSSEALYDATLGPFFPALDAAAFYDRHYDSSLAGRDYTERGYNLTLSYLLFDGGKRYANRNSARLNFETVTEEARKQLIYLEFNVKIAFYTALARRDSLEQKMLQLKDAEKDLEVAQGRYKHGIAKISDTLQASVRLQQAKFNVINAEGALRKSEADLNSLIGGRLGDKPTLEGALDAPPDIPSLSALHAAVLERPEIRQAENTVSIARNTRKIEMSAFWPVLSADASYSWNKSGFSSLPHADDRIVGLSAKWSIFELGRFFKTKSASIETDVAAEKLLDIRRELVLSVQKSFEDLITAHSKLNVAREQLKQAEYNYKQSFGEYKVGKADILSLVQAESLLADARDQLILTRLDIQTSKAVLERAAAVPRLEALPSDPSSTIPQVLK